MASKGQNHKIVRRKMRHAEKAAFRRGVEIRSEKTLGRVSRRGWGGGVAFSSKNELSTDS